MISTWDPPEVATSGNRAIVAQHPCCSPYILKQNIWKRFSIFRSKMYCNIYFSSQFLQQHCDIQFIWNTVWLIVSSYCDAHSLIHWSFDLVVEQEIKSNAPEEEALALKDLWKILNYAWRRLALETLGMIPPEFGSFRTATGDVEFNGYLTPMGQQQVK